MTREQFIKKYKRDAIFTHILTGVPASINLAVATIESNNGNSLLSRNNNNYHGIKGEGVNYSTQEFINGNWITIRDRFKTFSDAFGSFLGFADFLKTNNKYKQTLQQKNYINFSHELQKAGYATAPNYAVSLINVIEKNELYKLDFWGRFRYLFLILILATMSIFFYIIFRNKTKK